MTSLLVLIPVALLLGVIGLVAFLWALQSGQFDDLDGAAQRILVDEAAPGSASGGAPAAATPQATAKTPTIAA